MKFPTALINRRCALALAAAALLAGQNALAWTDKPVKLLVPAPAGGTADVFARLISDQLSAEIGQPVVVENKPGAGGAIAVQALRAAPANGQTLLVCASNVLTEVPHVLKGNFDPLKDVTPVAALAKGTMVLVGSPTLPATDVKSLVAYFKSHPGGNFASYSAGTSSQYAGLIFSQKAGLDLQHVPFPGSPPALVELMAGRIPVMFDGLTTSKAMIASGKLKVFGVAAKSRSPQLPGVPTMAEQGYPELDFGNWMGVIAASGTSPELVAKMHAALARIGANPKVRERLAANGFDPVEDQPADKLAQSVKAEYERNGAIVKAFDIRLNN